METEVVVTEKVDEVVVIIVGVTVIIVMAIAQIITVVETVEIIVADKVTNSNNKYDFLTKSMEMKYVF